MDIRKEDAINVLNILRNEENKDKIDRYLNLINSMDEVAWNNFIKEYSIKSVEDLSIKARKLLEQKQDKIELNDLIDYGCNGNTLHIHVIPKDVHSMLNRKGLEIAKLKLIDALEKIKVLLQQDANLSDINNVYAVSPILKRPIITIFADLGFETKVLDFERAKEDEEFKHFCKMFENKDKNPKKLGRAYISKEKLLSREWNELKDNYKAKIENNIGEERE